MKLCFFVNNYSFTGGLERVFSIVTNGLSKKVSVDIVSMYNIPKKSPYSYSGNIKIDIIHNTSKKHYLLDSLKTIKELKRIIKSNNYDFLIYASELLSPYAYFACKNTNTKPICWMHTPAFTYDSPVIQRLLRYFSMKKAHFTITLTNKSKNKLIEKYKTDKVDYIPNPVDPTLDLNTQYNPDSKRIISVGRLCFAKYYEKLIEVANIVMPKLPGWTWDIYGDGDNNIKQELKNLIKNNSLENMVYLKGNSENIYKEYKNYSMLVMTSRYEGFPMSLLEGMSQGLPLIAFDILTGPKEIIKNNENGMLIEPFNINKMADSIIYLANNKNTRMQMSKQGKNIINNYSINNITNLWIELLSKI